MPLEAMDTVPERFLSPLHSFHNRTCALSYLKSYLHYFQKKYRDDRLLHSHVRQSQLQHILNEVTTLDISWIKTIFLRTWFSII